MGDPKDVKCKGQYHLWSGPERKLLLRTNIAATMWTDAMHMGS